MAEDHLSADVMALNSKVDFAKSQEIRTAALAAMFQLDAKTRVQRAARAKLRNVEDIKIGQWVFIHRKNAFNKHWREGPAAVVMISGTTIWATMRGKVYKVNKEMVRPATTDELRGIEELNELLPELREETRDRRTRKAYRDYTGEVPDDVPRAPRTPRPMSRRPSQASTAMAPTTSTGTQETGSSATQDGGGEDFVPRTQPSNSPAQTRAASEDIAPHTQRRRLDPNVQQRVDDIEGASARIPSTPAETASARIPSTPAETASARIPSTPATASAHTSAASAQIPRERSRSPPRQDEMFVKIFEGDRRDQVT
eukprot:2113144-Amphidinium_carterae.2